MTLTEKMKFLRDLMLSCTPDVYHYISPRVKCKEWIVWQESAETESLAGDNSKNLQSVEFDIELYTKDEYSKLIDAIQDTLAVMKVPFTYDGSQYEPETRLIHHSWRCRL